jgi:putative tricarboxylic transport membrane protein
MGAPVTPQLDPRPEPSARPTARTPYMRPIRWVALAIVIFGLLYLWQATQIRGTSTYAAVSARAFPLATGIGILLSGIWLFLLPGAPPAPDAPERTRLDWPRVLLLLLTVIGYAMLFRPLGYMLSTALMLLAGSQILGERRHLLRDLIVSIALAVALNYAFTRLLNINLPAGLIGF